MALDDATLAILRQTPILRLFEDAALRVVANVADIRHLRPDEALFRKGDRSDGGFVVMAGAIEVTREDLDEPMLLGPGSLVGQVALFVRMQRPASAYARENSTVIRISPTLMRRVLQQYPSAVEPMRDALARDLAEMGEDLERVHASFAAIERG